MTNYAGNDSDRAYIYGTPQYRARRLEEEASTLILELRDARAIIDAMRVKAEPRQEYIDMLRGAMAQAIAVMGAAATEYDCPALKSSMRALRDAWMTEAP